MKVVHYTDPGCPYAFSAEPLRLRLAWVFGSQLEWDTRMIVLARSPEEYESKGLTTTKMVAGLASLAASHGMPIDTTERSRLAATEPACRAVASVRTHLPERVEPFLRALRVRAMLGELLDEQSTIDGAAADASLDAAQVREWMERSGAREALEADRAGARSPHAAALAQDHKLAPSEDGGRRYTAPSMEFHSGDGVLVAPGFQPWETYDALVANLDHELERREAAATAQEVLAWAQYPLATVEVAAIMDVSAEDARSALAEAGASFAPAGSDGYWS